MRKWINEMLSGQGEISSKRFITFLAFGLMSIAFLANLFFAYTIEQFMFESMSFIVIAGLGFTASEFFSGNRNPKPKPPKDEETPDEPA